MKREAPPGRIRDWIVGQERVFEYLDQAIAAGRLGHALLLLGPAGCGRTRLALALAQQLHCPEPSAPCGACASCRMTAHLNHPDLHLVVPALREEGPETERGIKKLAAYAGDRLGLLGIARSTTIGIDRVRELRAEVAKARVVSERRVVVISGADRMTEPAAQSALKLVEEPPPATTLLLTAEDTSRILPTLVSRVQIETSLGKSLNFTDRSFQVGLLLAAVALALSIASSWRS